MGKDQEILRLKSELEQAALTTQLIETSLKDKYESELKSREVQIKDRDDAIERLQDMKAKLSTKMVGETLGCQAAPGASTCKELRRFFTCRNDMSTDFTSPLRATAPLVPRLMP